MRVDIREATRAAARAERELNGTHVALVADALVEQLRGVWSEPVQVMLEPAEDGLLEITLRTAEAAR